AHPLLTLSWSHLNVTSSEKSSVNSPGGAEHASFVPPAHLVIHHPTVETASLTATNAPTDPLRSLFGFSDPASLFPPAPAASPLLATASWRAGAADRGVTVPHAAGSHAATHPSRSALATAVAAGWQRAGICEGWRAPAPEDADMWAGTSAHLAVASEHLSELPQRMRAARRGERAEDGRERRRAGRA
ncbi:unnamed protein product, partial [Rangifer tarandus platyrhynchus]